MANEMETNVPELIKITIALLKRFQEVNGSNISINADFYWDIGIDEQYNPYIEPNLSGLGQLSDDLEELRKVYENEQYIIYDFKKLSSILRAICSEYRMM